MSSSRCRAPREAARLSTLRAAQRRVCRAAVDEQRGRANAGSMDSSPTSTPRRGGRPQGVGRATPEQPRSRRRPLSSVSTSTPPAALRARRHRHELCLVRAHLVGPQILADGHRAAPLIGALLDRRTPPWRSHPVSFFRPAAPKT
jgi:hypothetical protein